jgi:probable addiction module antidote protein
MNTVFIGGSRHVSRFPSAVKQRLDNVLASQHRVVVGDANGADKAVQRHFFDAEYCNVTVFCSGDEPRNNLGSWPTHRVEVPEGVKGFHFFAAKDREMAREADFGLMIWDGKSPGTILNIARLIQSDKPSVLFNIPEKTAINIKNTEQLRKLIHQHESTIQADIQKRATPLEWSIFESEPLLPLLNPPPSSTSEFSNATEQRESPTDDAVQTLNAALASGDAKRIINVLGAIARDRGMSKISRETGLARESLYRALDEGGNPEFMTIMKVLSSLGVRLEARSCNQSSSGLAT